MFFWRERPEPLLFDIHDSVDTSTLVATAGGRVNQTVGGALKRYSPGLTNRVLHCVQNRASQKQTANRVGVFPAQSLVQLTSNQNSHRAQSIDNNVRVDRRN